ncbi:hypothetical protein H0H92_014463 [Tricholoma furcatifolium]|nr:hypothetical protein H0H92_014463 [Tricholoma furcatifolium]
MDNSPSTLSQTSIAHSLVKTAVAKHNERYESTFFKAVAAGVMLSFGGLLSEIFSGGAAGLTDSNPGIVKVLGGFVFPVGLVMIVLQGLELLTSNMMVCLPVSKGQVCNVHSIEDIPHGRDQKTNPLVGPSTELAHRFLVLFGNLVGSLFFAAILVYYSGIVSTDPYITYIQTFAIHKAVEPHWYQIFLRGIGCNWLVSVAIWQATGAKETISKIFAIWIPIWIFVAAGFDHVIANMFSVPLGILFGADLTVAEYIRKSLIAAFLGNTVGALIVALPATYYYLSDYEADGLRAVEDATSSSDKTT